MGELLIIKCEEYCVTIFHSVYKPYVDNLGLEEVKGDGMG